MNSPAQDPRVTFVGAGPGAVDLITVRGARALAAADVVLHDALIDPEFRSLAPKARWIDVGKRGFGPAATQAHIHAQLVHWARRHPRVVRLKGGDPSVFGRLEEELLALAEAGIGCEVVPGVTAALAAAAQTQRPLTRRGRGRSVTLTTAMTRDGTSDEPTMTVRQSQADTEVFYMAGQQLGGLRQRLLAQGWPGDAAVDVVSRAGCADAFVSRHALRDLGDATPWHAGRPTVVTVGVGAQPLAERTHPRIVPAAARARRQPISAWAPGLGRAQARHERTPA